MTTPSKEFETRENPEAEFVADMDLLDMCLTALKYERQARYDASENISEYDDLSGFFETANKNIQTDIGRKLYNEVYRKHMKEIK